MKTKTLFFLLYFLFPVAINAQPGKKRAKASALPVAISGTITEWTHNDDFLYDGFYLQSDGAYFVKIPAHMARAVYDCGNTVTVEGTLKYSPEGVREIKMSSVRGNGSIAYNMPAPRLRAMALSEIVSGTGTATQLQLNKKGDVSGYFLDNGAILRVPPHVARQLTQLIQSNTVLEYTGIVKTLKEGEMSKGDNTIICCKSLIINGVQYLTSPHLYSTNYIK